MNYPAPLHHDPLQPIRALRRRAHRPPWVTQGRPMDPPPAGLSSGTTGARPPASPGPPPGAADGSPKDDPGPSGLSCGGTAAASPGPRTSAPAGSRRHRSAGGGLFTRSRGGVRPLVRSRLCGKDWDDQAMLLSLPRQNPPSSTILAGARLGRRAPFCSEGNTAAGATGF